MNKVSIRELRTTAPYTPKDEQYTWIITSVTLTDLKKFGICFYRHFSQSDITFEFYKYGRNIFRVIY